jgi:tRNA (guanine6-N2)-methyltransferase
VPDADRDRLSRVPYQPRVDLDRPVRERLTLRTVPGAVDYLAEDLRTLPATVVGRAPDRLVVDYAGPLRPLAAVRYFDIAALELSTVDSSLRDGILSTVERPIRFRVGDVPQRWELRDRLTEEYGWRNDPGSWDVNVEPHGVELGALYLTQRFGELARTPASTNPVIAAVMVRLAKIQPGQTVLDPFCGAGTLLVLAAAMAEPGRLVGSEIQVRWLDAAASNLRGGPGRLLRADARHLPIASGAADRVVANLPFGKRVGTHRINEDLYPAALREIARVLPGNGRAVLLTEDKRLFRETVQRTPLLRVIKEVVLARGGVHPSVYVVSKRGR